MGSRHNGADITPIKGMQKIGGMVLRRAGHDESRYEVSKNFKIESVQTTRW